MQFQPSYVTAHYSSLPTPLRSRTPPQTMVPVSNRLDGAEGALPFVIPNSTRYARSQEHVGKHVASQHDIVMT